MSPWLRAYFSFEFVHNDTKSAFANVCGTMHENAIAGLEVTEHHGRQVFSAPLFTAKECAQLIALASKRGFTKSSVSGGGHGRTGREDAVTNSYAVINNEALAARIWSQVKRVIPIGVSHLEKNPHFAPNQGWTPHCVHPCMRFYRYNKGESFAEHIDYKQQRVDVLKDGSRRVLQSVYTLLIYLNDDFDGGETGYWPNHAGIHCRFRREQEKQHAFKKRHQVIIKPVTGMAVIQDQNLLHEGLPPTSVGKPKYILRTDVIFERVIPRSAKLNNIKPDPPKIGDWTRQFETSCKNYAI